jgi:hypothetical protein
VPRGYAGTFQPFVRDRSSQFRCDHRSGRRRRADRPCGRRQILRTRGLPDAGGGRRRPRARAARAQNASARGSRNTNRALLTGRAGAAYSSENSARPSSLAARMSRRALPTNAAAPVIASRVHWTSARTRCLGGRRRGRPAVGWAARARSKRWARSASSSSSARASASSTLPETRSCLPAPGACSRERSRRPGRRPPRGGARHPARAVGAQPGVLGCDPGAAGGEELADLLLRVHEMQRKPGCPLLGDTASTPLNRDSHVPRSRAFLDEAKGRHRHERLQR